jgi:hypothetical protein
MEKLNDVEEAMKVKSACRSSRRGWAKGHSLCFSISLLCISLRCSKKIYTSKIASKTAFE